MELLIADDEPSILELLRRALSGKNIHVTGVETGEEAWELIETRRFDILLTDIHMESHSAGLDLARKVRQKHPETDVLVMTSYSLIDNTINTLKLGAYDFIMKPLDLFLVKFSILRCMERRNLHARIKMCVKTAVSGAAALGELAGRLEGLKAGAGEPAAAGLGACSAAVEEIRRTLEALKALDAPPKLEV